MIGWIVRLCSCWLLGVSMHAHAADDATVRVATYNVSLNRKTEGALVRDLQNNDAQAAKVARVLRTIQPDIVLLNEFDYDKAGVAAELFRSKYLESDIPGLQKLAMPYAYSDAVNTGEPSGLDLNKDGSTDGPADAFGFGNFPGQYGMLLLSKYPIRSEDVRTFRKLLWHDMPGAAAPVDPKTNQPWYSDEEWQRLRLSSKSHWDVPVQIGDKVLHVLASHPTPPAFDGPEDRNGRRNHDEIRFWADYVSNLSDDNRGNWIRDDAGRMGGIAKEQPFVLLGDLNADPVDGGSHQHAIRRLLEHPRVNSTFTPKSDGAAAAAKQQGKANAKQQGDAAFDTADFSDRVVGNLRVDYVLPSRECQVKAGAVVWPQSGEPLADAIDCSDHRMVWLDLAFP